MHVESSHVQGFAGQDPAASIDRNVKMLVKSDQEMSGWSSQVDDSRTLLADRGGFWLED